MIRGLVVVLGLCLCSVCYGGIDFDGTDDYVNTNSDLSLNGSTQMSVSAWVSWNDTGSAEHVITGNWDTDAGSHMLRLEPSSNDIEAFVRKSGANMGGSFSDLTINDTNWHFITMVFCSTDGLEMYLDNVKSVTTHSTGAAVYSPAGRDIFIGADNWASGTRDYFDGIITEVAIWNTALTDEEILALYQRNFKGTPLYIQPDNLVGYWPMNDGQAETSADGDTVEDASTNTNNGTGDNGANNTGLTWKRDPSNLSGIEIKGGVTITGGTTIGN